MSNSRRLLSGVTVRTTPPLARMAIASGMAEGSLNACATLAFCTGSPNPTIFFRPVYQLSSSPSGSEPTTLSSWLPIVEYQGMFRPGLVNSLTAASSSPCS